MPPDQAKPPNPPRRLDNDLKLTVGQLFYWDANGHPQGCTFQFNPTELERSRSVKFTRTPTGNTLEEPNVGPHNQPKRKFTRKPDPWDMTLTLRFDASHGLNAQTEASPLPKVANPPPPPAKPKAPPKSYADEIQRVVQAMRFFEALVEPRPSVSENQKVGNASETPPPPMVFLAFGKRAWRCAVKTVRIKEEDYTYDLYPRRFEATLTLEIVETVQQNDMGRLGAEL